LLVLLNACGSITLSLALVVSRSYVPRQMSAGRRPDYSRRSTSVGPDDDILDERFHVLKDRASLRHLERLEHAKVRVRGNDALVVCLISRVVLRGRGLLRRRVALGANALKKGSRR
jgi:hypothetical protein